MKMVLKSIANFGASASKFKLSDIDTIVGWIIEQSKENKEGLEKAEAVIVKFGGEWGGRASWVGRTVVQLAYAIAKIRGIIKE